MAKSIQSRRVDKPEKPYVGFPLFPHATKRWAKKILGKVHYFGSWSNSWQPALQKFQDQRDDLYAGQLPRVRGEGPSIDELKERFLAWKRQMVEAGELEAETLQEYTRASNHVTEVLGSRRLVSDLASDDFEKLRSRLAKTRGP